MRPAIGWISNVIFVLTNPPYNFSLEDIDIVVVSHGRELPVFLEENRDKYQDIMERIEGLTHYGVNSKSVGWHLLSFIAPRKRTCTLLWKRCPLQ
jgi:intracellular sulfur oxidation DsrE/DsrF family protein